MTPAIKQPFRVVVLFSGRASNFKALAKHFAAPALGVQIVGAVTDNPRAAGIGLAQQLGIPCQTVPKGKDRSPEAWAQELVAAVSQHQPDLIVLAGFMRVLDASFLRAFKGQVINIHPSLLPAFRGMRAIEQALEARVRIAGCSVHYVVEEVDAGPVVAQGAVPVFPADSAESLAARILKIEHELLPSVVEMIANGEVRYVTTGKGGALTFAETARLAAPEQSLVSLKRK